MGWTTDDSESLYNVSKWGQGYFHINGQGHVEVRQQPETDQPGIDLFELLGQLRRREVETPILLRFDGILRSRVRMLNVAFANARSEYGYEGRYRSVFPIKVNQDRHVVEGLLEEGRKHGMGLEVGSKPELLAVMTLATGDDALMVCNGYKDTEYVDMALLSTKLGITPILVIEKQGELETILESSERLGIDPVIGVRVKLGGRGAGRWQDSIGDKSKFGLTAREITAVLDALAERGKLGCLRLLHFHIGSQITQIRALKDALREAAHMFAGLRAMGAPIEWFDVGGGLGVDYDGSQTHFNSSMNYTMQEYANDVVYTVLDTCNEHDLPQPTILSESGRALSAHHAVLITEALGVSDNSNVGIPAPPTEDENDVVQEISDVCDGITVKNFQEAYHDILQLRERALTFFNIGQLSIRERARVEEFFWRASEKILRITRRLEYVPDDLDGLERAMADTYFLNFSVFQSLPDSWAISQLFPVMPIHRLEEEPTRRAVLADITCDSDGKVDKFIDLRDVKSTLELHPLREKETYYIAFFLVGAYQEILGDMHNLFGDTNIVHVDVDDSGRPRLRHLTRGDQVQDVLGYVDYVKAELLKSLRRKVEAALEEGLITFEESALISRRYEAGLRGYTYLTRESEHAAVSPPEAVPR